MNGPSLFRQLLAVVVAAALFAGSVMLLYERVIATDDDAGDSVDDEAVAVPEPTAEPDADVVPTPDEAESVDNAVTPTAEPVEVAPTPVAPPPFPDQFEPAANEVQADAKRLGTLVVYQLTNYAPDTSVGDLVSSVTGNSARARALEEEAAVVHHPGMWSRGTVEYAQLGGHRDDRISVMVVVRQEVGEEGTADAERVETRTMDVRLERGAAGAWDFEELASAGGEPVARPADLSPVAASVVEDPRIHLPDTAVWDIYSGEIDIALLEVMLDLAERTPYSVIVLKTGHPYNVFGTNRVSNHSIGRAVDIHDLGSELVIDSHDVTSSIYALSEWVVSRTDIIEFGSPWLFEDAVAHTFTNEVHHDHIHVGVYPAG